jgi:hypothetical protein
MRHHLAPMRHSRIAPFRWKYIAVEKGITTTFLPDKRTRYFRNSQIQAYFSYRATVVCTYSFLAALPPGTHCSEPHRPKTNNLGRTTQPAGKLQESKHLNPYARLLTEGEVQRHWRGKM